jgi:hypothetical protein
MQGCYGEWQKLFAMGFHAEADTQKFNGWFF